MLFPCCNVADGIHATIGYKNSIIHFSTCIYWTPTSLPGTLLGTGDLVIDRQVPVLITELSMPSYFLPVLIELSMPFLSLHTPLVPLLSKILVTFKPCSYVTRVFNTQSRILHKGKFMPAFEQMGQGGELFCFSIARRSKKSLRQTDIFWGGILGSPSVYIL